MFSAKKKSVFQQILIVNFALSFVFILAYMVMSGYAHFQFTREAKKHTEQIMGTLTENYYAESIRMSSFIELCSKDRSFVMGLSNKLNVKEFVQYGMQVSEKLSLIQYSLPYAENVYAYVKNNDTFIQPNGIMLDSDLFLNTLELGSLESQKIPDFSKMTTGFYRLGQDIFYVYQYYDYGLLIIRVNTDRFCRLDEVRSVLSDYRVLILDADGEYFAGDAQSYQQLSEQYDRSVWQKIGSFIIDDERYSMHARTMGDGFQLVLLEKSSRSELYQGNTSYIYGLGAFILFLGSGLLVYLNTKIYHPLQQIAKRYTASGERKNEFDLIHDKLSEMVAHNQEMENQLLAGRQQETNLELKYALLSKTRIRDNLADALRRQYGCYRLVTIIMQKSVEDSSELLSLADDYVADAFESKTIPISSTVHAYLLSDGYTLEEIISVLSQYLQLLEEDVLAFIGISDLSEDYVQLHQLYRQSWERLLSNRIPVRTRYAIYSEMNGAVNTSSGKLSVEILDTVAKATLNGRPEDVQKVLEHIFFPASSVTLREMVSAYEQLSELLITLATQSGTTDSADLSVHEITPVYNPVYMYNRLLADYLNLNAAASPKENTMRYEVVEYISSHYMEPLSLDSISIVFGITPVYLSAWFKKNMGINLSTFISNVRMKEAEKKIRAYPHKKMSEIAAEIGIPSMTTFTRQFKNYFGCTPEQFRQQFRGGNN